MAFGQLEEASDLLVNLSPGLSNPEDGTEPIWEGALPDSTTPGCPQKVPTQLCVVSGILQKQISPPMEQGYAPQWPYGVVLKSVCTFFDALPSKGRGLFLSPWM